MSSMTVRQLRQALFELDDQEQIVDAALLRSFELGQTPGINHAELIAGLTSERLGELYDTYTDDVAMIKSKVAMDDSMRRILNHAETNARHLLKLVGEELDRRRAQ